MATNKWPKFEYVGQSIAPLPSAAPPKNPLNCACGTFYPPEKFFGKDGYPTQMHYKSHVKKS